MRDKRKNLGSPKTSPLGPSSSSPLSGGPSNRVSDPRLRVIAVWTNGTRLDTIAGYTDPLTLNDWKRLGRDPLYKNPPWDLSDPRSI